MARAPSLQSPATLWSCLVLFALASASFCGATPDPTEVPSELLQSYATPDATPTPEPPSPCGGGNYWGDGVKGCDSSPPPMKNPEQLWLCACSRGGGVSPAADPEGSTMQFKGTCESARGSCASQCRESDVCLTPVGVASDGATPKKRKRNGKAAPEVPFLPAIP